MPVANRVCTSVRSSSGSSPSATRSTISSPVTERDLDAYQRWSWIQSRRLSSSRSCEISTPSRRTGSLIATLLDQLEPVEAPRSEGQQVRELADPREPRVAEQLDRVSPLVLAQVELDGLGGARKVVDAQDEIILEPAQVGEDARV